MAAINYDEWLSELEKVTSNVRADGDGLTTLELVELTGRCDVWVREKIRNAIRAGTICCCQKRSYRIDGKPTLVPAYKLAKKKK